MSILNFCGNHAFEEMLSCSLVFDVHMFLIVLMIAYFINNAMANEFIR